MANMISPRHVLQYLAFIAVSKILNWCSRPSALRIGAALGNIAFRLPRFNKRAQINLLTSFKTKNNHEITAIAGAMRRHLGRVFTEYCRTDDIKFFDQHNDNDKPKTKVTGFHHIEQAIQQNKPILCVGAHIGHWELIGIMMEHLNMPTAGFYFPPSNPFIDQIISQRRHKSIQNMTLIPRGRKGLVTAMHHLKRKNPLYILVDQKAAGINVPFFNRNAPTSTACARLQRKTQAVIIPVRCMCLPDDTYHAIIDPPLKVKAGLSPKQHIDDITKRLNRHIESWIRKDPHQWLWIHNRWKDPRL